MDDKYEQAIALLEASLGWDAIDSREDIDFQIVDIWNVSKRLTLPQSYYFIGSRGAGKSSLIAKALQLVDDENRSSKKQTLSCAMNSSSFIAVGQGASEETIKRFVFTVFETMLGQLKQRKGYENIAKLSSIYAAIREWADFRDWEKLMSSFEDNRQSSPVPPKTTSVSGSQLRLSTDFASISFSLLDVGPIQVGHVSFTPIKIGFEHETQTSILSQSQVQEMRGNLNSEIGLLDDFLSDILEEVAEQCKKEEIERILIFVDDLHFIPIPIQLKIIHLLRRIVGQMRKLEITIAFKLFSATNLSPYITDVLGLIPRDLQIMHIESSLDGLEQKRQAIENCLARLLKGKQGWSEKDFRSLFRREVIDLVLILAGGHPRRFLEICASIIKMTQGRTGSSLYRIIMLSAAEVIRSYRRNLVVQLGIDSDPQSAVYRRAYEESVTRLVDQFQSMNSPFFTIPRTEIPSELEQWINDAVVIGDLLEIVSLDWKGVEPFRLLALNPATIYDKTGRSDFRINYRDIVELQIGAQGVEDLQSPHIEEIAA